MAVDASGGARPADGGVRVQPGGGGRAVGGTRADRLPVRVHRRRYAGDDGAGPGSGARHRRARRRVPARRRAVRCAARPSGAGREGGGAPRATARAAPAATPAPPTGRGNRWRRSTSTGCGRARPRRPSVRRVAEHCPVWARRRRCWRRRPGRPCRSRAHGSSSRCWCRAARRPTTPGARRRAPRSPGYRVTPAPCHQTPRLAPRLGRV